MDGLQFPPVVIQDGFLLLQGRFLALQGFDQFEVPADHPLEQVHPGGKIPEIRGPQQHIQVVHLAVFIDIPQALFVDLPGLVVIGFLGFQGRLVLTDPDLQGMLPALYLSQLPFGFCQLVLGRHQPFHGIADFLFFLFPLGILGVHLLLDLLQLRLLILDGFGPGHRCR